MQTAGQRCRPSRMTSHASKSVKIMGGRTVDFEGAWRTKTPFQLSFPSLCNVPCNRNVCFNYLNVCCKRLAAKRAVSLCRLHYSVSEFDQNRSIIGRTQDPKFGHISSCPTWFYTCYYGYFGFNTSPRTCLTY